MHTTLFGVGDLLDLRALDVRIFDCRFDLADPEAGYAKYAANRIPGAVYAHLDHDLSGAVDVGRTGRHPLPDLATFRGFLRRHGVTDGRQVVAYDDAGGLFAARLWWMLRWAGHASVAVLDGGYAAWLRGSRGDRHEPRELAADTARALAMGTVRDHLNERGLCLLDARANDRFHGRNEAIDPKAGHIPGAINAPFQDNLGGDGKFLDKATLRRRFEALLAGDDRPVACYCGSGVSAAHNVLAMTHAGLPEPALFVGSWSQWITDPDNPTET